MNHLKSRNVYIFSKFCSIILLNLIFFNCLYGQNMKLIKNSGNDAPLVIMVIEDNLMTDMNVKIDKDSKLLNVSFLVVNGTKSSIVSIKDSVNVLLNSNLSISKTSVYLVVVGSKDFYEKQNQFNDDLFSSKYLIQTDNEPIKDLSYKITKYQDLDLVETINDLNKTHLWDIDLFRIMEKQTASTSKNEIGFSVTKYVPTGFKFDSDLPKSLTNYNLSFSHNLFKHFKIIENIALGFKKPNMQDPSSGMSGYTYFSCGIGAIRFYNTKSKLKVYSGLGVFSTSFSTMKAKTKQNSSGSPSIDRNSFKNWGMSINSGLDYRLGDNVFCNFRVAYNVDLNKYFVGKNFINSLDFQMGISINIFKRKNNVYEYLRLKQ